VRLGLFGGSFDPVHRGHVEPVQAARRALGLERVLYLPTAVPPHRPARAFAPALARFAMVELALIDQPGLLVSPRELTLGRPAYTVETLEQFRRELPAAELHLIVGADAFADLHHWVRWREIVGLARLVVLVRPGWERPAVLEAAPDELRAQDERGRIHWMENPPVGVSSTTLRDILARGEEPPPGSVPPLVLEYIRKYSLYR
jgi:nicotinate-nucleotide adenylyltransferase